MINKNVLFVDDDRNALRCYRRIIKGQGLHWDTTFTESTHDAEQMLYAHRFDAMVVDLRMPGLSGLDFFRRLKESSLNRATPTILVTGYPDPRLRIEAIELGLVDVLNKPVDRGELIARLRNMLQWNEEFHGLEQDRDRLSRRVSAHHRERTASRVEPTVRLAKAAEQLDQQTGQHVLRVALYTQQVCEQLSLDPSLTQSIVLAAPLHDIGKIGVPDAILLKRGPLSDQEWSMMTIHCKLGASLLSGDIPWMMAGLTGESWSTANLPPLAPDPVLRIAQSIAIAHHEKWNGSGYPHQLAREAIPLEARIVAICDVFDSLRSPRPYKAPFDMNRTMEIIEQGRGTHFAPDVFDAFMARLNNILELEIELQDELECNEVARNEEYSLCRR